MDLKSDRKSAKSILAILKADGYWLSVLFAISQKNALRLVFRAMVSGSVDSDGAKKE